MSTPRHRGPARFKGALPTRDEPWSIGTADAQLWCSRSPGHYGWQVFVGLTERIHETALVVEDVRSDADLRLVLKRWAGVRT